MYPKHSWISREIYQKIIMIFCQLKARTSGWLFVLISRSLMVQCLQGLLIAKCRYHIQQRSSLFKQLNVEAEIEDKSSYWSTRRQLLWEMVEPVQRITVYKISVQCICLFAYKISKSVGKMRSSTSSNIEDEPGRAWHNCSHKIANSSGCTPILFLIIL